MVQRSVVTRASLMLGCLTAAGLFVGRIVPSHAQTTTAIVAEIALSKNLEGQVVVHTPYAYKTSVLGKTVEMASLPLSLYLSVTPNTHCDELYKSLNGKIYCFWNTTLRTDEGAFGVHSGTFQWDDGVGNVIEGTMQGTIGCGTHRLPGTHDEKSATENCEECRTSLHFEGTLSGQVVSGPLKTQYHSFTVSASYAGMLETAGGITAIKTAAVSLDGVSIVPSTIVK